MAVEMLGLGLWWRKKVTWVCEGRSSHNLRHPGIRSQFWVLGYGLIFSGFLDDIPHNDVAIQATVVCLCYFVTLIFLVLGTHSKSVRVNSAKGWFVFFLTLESEVSVTYPALSHRTGMWFIKSAAHNYHSDLTRPILLFIRHTNLSRCVI